VGLGKSRIGKHRPIPDRREIQSIVMPGVCPADLGRDLPWFLQR
jgi:hypothetical protein